RPAYAGSNTMNALLKVMQEDPERPSSLDARTDRDLETICLKCLRREPHLRYATAAELADDLERWLRGEPFRARRAGATERTWKWARRHPALATLTGAIAVLLVTVTAVSLGFAAKLQAERDIARKAQADAEAAEAQRREQLYRSYLAEAGAWRTSRRVGQRFEGLAAVRRALALLDRLGPSPAERRQEIDRLRTPATPSPGLPD